MGEARTANSFIENHRWKVAFTTPASAPWIVQGKRKFGWVDNEGQSAAGGLSLVQHDVTITGGQMPPQESARFKGMQVWVEMSDGSPVDPEEALAILQNTNLFLETSGTPYDLGPAVAWKGPVQTEGAIPVPRGFTEPKLVEGSTPLRIIAHPLRDIGGSVLTASKTYVLVGDMPAERYWANEAAGKGA